jgi:hypothetical protein
MYSLVLPGGLVRVPSLKGLLTGATAQNAPVTVSTAGTTNIVANTTKPFLFCFQKVIVSAGAYTRNLTLDKTNAVLDSIIDMDIELAGGSTAIIPIYSQTVSGSPIESVNAMADARYYNFRAKFNGTDWEKLSGAFQL